MSGLYRRLNSSYRRRPLTLHTMVCLNLRCFLDLPMCWLPGLVRNICNVYLDILIIGKTFEEHLENIARVLDQLHQAGLKLKPSKCHFLLRQVWYLGHTISDQGVSPDAIKIEAVKNFPKPTDLKSLRSFLGLASYYRRFIPGFSAVANPLFKLTRKKVNF